EQLAAALVHLLRDVDLHAREQVALAPALELRRAAALDLQELAVLRARGDLQRDRPVRRRHVDASAEGSRGKAHGHIDQQVRDAAPVVDRRLRDARPDVEVACRAAADAGLALALEPDARAVLDARGDLHRVALRPALAARAVTVVARLLDHGAVAAGGRARLRGGGETPRLGPHAAGVGARADHRRRARVA